MLRRVDATDIIGRPAFRTDKEMARIAAASTTGRSEERIDPRRLM